MGLQAGSMVAHYRVAGKIGEGGMGEVWRAEDTRLNREIALKVLPDAFAADADRMARFRREAQLLASLNHPGIGAIYGLEESGDTRCLVLELIEGKTLAERLEEGPLPLKQALDAALQIAEALEAAHDRGIIHRDLKPANIKLTPAGKVKVLDFGLAKALAGEPGSPDVSLSPTLTHAATQQGMILGTAAYMSPEQAKGEEVDRRADIWAFGVILHEMLAGGRLFSQNSVSETLAAVLMKEPDMGALTAGTPGSIRRLLARCLHKDPRRRLQAMGEARIAITTYLEDPSAAADATTGSVQAAAAAAAPATAGWLPWMVTAALAVVLSGALWWLWPAGHGEPATPIRLKAEVGPGLVLDDGPGAPMALSPDGTLAVYAARDGSQTRLHLRRMDQLEATPMTGTEGARSPFFSPDGKWIGFFTNRQLKKVSIAGGAPLTLAETGTNRGGTWSTDGVIVFAPDITSGLSRIADTGGTPEPITERGNEERSHRWPWFLPGGKHVLFIVQATGERYDQAGIEIVHIDTGERTALPVEGTYPRYLPTGHMTFVREATLFAVPLDLDRLEAAGTPAPVLEGVRSSLGASTGDGTALYAFSGNGNLAYVEGNPASQRYRIIWKERDGGAESALLAEERSYYAPSLSPDGKLLALQVTEESGTDVWVYDLERSVLTRLTFTGTETMLPVWTRDGRRIVFSSRQDGQSGVYWMPADGSSAPELIYADGRALQPISFSPSGDLLLHSLNSDTSWDLEVIRFQDGKPSPPEPFLAGPAVEVFPQFSPDGKWVAYLSNESGQFEVYVRPYPGPGGRWQISTDGGSTPYWTRGGKEIVYRKDDRWMAVPVEAADSSLRVGRAEVLFQGSYVSLPPFPSYAVTADGKRLILFQGDDRQGDFSITHLTLVFNWFDEVRALSAQRR